MSAGKVYGLNWLRRKDRIRGGEDLARAFARGGRAGSVPVGRQIAAGTVRVTTTAPVLRTRCPEERRVQVADINHAGGRAATEPRPCGRREYQAIGDCHAKHLRYFFLFGGEHFQPKFIVVKDYHRSTKHGQLRSEIG